MATTQEYLQQGYTVRNVQRTTRGYNVYWVKGREVIRTSISIKNLERMGFKSASQYVDYERTRLQAETGDTIAQRQLAEIESAKAAYAAERREYYARTAEGGVMTAQPARTIVSSSLDQPAGTLTAVGAIQAGQAPSTGLSGGAIQAAQVITGTEPQPVIEGAGGYAPVTPTPAAERLKLIRSAFGETSFAELAAGTPIMGFTAAGARMDIGIRPEGIRTAELGAGLPRIRQERFTEFLTGQKRQEALSKALGITPPAKTKPLSTKEIAGRIGKKVTEITLGEGLKGAKGLAEISFYPTELGLRTQERLFPKATKLAKSLQAKAGINMDKIRSDLALNSNDVLSAAGLIGLGVGSQFQAGRIAIKYITAGIAAYEGTTFIKAPSPESFAQFAIFAVPAAAEIPSVAKFVGIKTFGTKVPVETVFAEEVLAGKTTFPRTKSPEMSIKEFKKAGDLLHTTDKRLSYSAGAIETGAGQRAFKGLFVTPAGRGSPYFTRLPSEFAPAELALLPRVSYPKALEIKGFRVERIPKKVLLQDVAAVNKYVGKQIGTGRAFVTGGSEARFNQQIAKALRTGGTSEIEAVIPAGERLYPLKSRVKTMLGFGEYVEYKERPVQIIEFTGRREGRGVRAGISAKEYARLSNEYSRALTRPPKVAVSSLFIRPRIRETVRPSVRPLISSRAVSRTVSRPSVRPVTRSVSRPSMRPLERPSMRPVGKPSTRLLGRPSVRPVGKPSVRPLGRPSTRPFVRPSTLVPPLYKPVQFKLKIKPYAEEEKLSKQLRRRFKYKPSLVGVEEQIKIAKIPKALTGFEIRGMKK